MADRLETTLLALKGQPADRPLDQLEPVVWRRLDEVRETRSGAGAAFAVRVAAVMGSLFLGLAAGGLGAASAGARDNEISVFSLGPQLAPSTLLEGRG
ncbi:hypothetical protein [Phenylobacterium sp.]|uniref:hypothetical protein n=1 Tax=Phenylobacterium sp. TaxID=1871053 RepID=UPI002CE33193|nr:hypothetical protein [Phenylobacterium sp.]HVI32018.1 hypothetical protein [Phenylobacterium sp.]